jgi:hypothetical protein
MESVDVNFTVLEKMGLLKDVLPLNIEFTVVTSPTLIDDTSWLKLVEPRNIDSIVVTLAVLVKMGLLKAVLPLNILSIVVTSPTSHEEMSWLKLVASWNMVAMLSTPGNLHPEMSSLKAW